MRKYIITAELHDLIKQVSLEEISYSKMVELLNEKADKWHKDKAVEINKLMTDFNNSLSGFQERLPSDIKVKWSNLYEKSII